jgi:hypothetical protein
MVAKKKAAASKGKSIAYDGTNFSKILPHFKGPAVVINILVHMDGCGPCQRIMGPYKRAVSKAPSDAVNVSVERQQLEKFNEDLQKNVEDADTVAPNGFPTVIKVDNSGKIISAVNPSPSNIGSLTSNDRKSLNSAMNEIPIAEESNQGMAMDDEGDEEDEGSVASVYKSNSGNSLTMSGGSAYRALAAAGQRLRRTRRQSRQTRQSRQSRQTRQRRQSRQTRQSRQSRQRRQSQKRQKRS